MLRISCSVFLIAIIGAASAQAQTTGTISGAGSVYVNGAQLSANTLSISAGDIIQTREGGSGNITFLGSTAAIDPNSIVRIEGSGMALDRGGILFATGKGMSIFARDLKISPANSAWTQFYVTRANGVIGILARKNDVTVSCGTGSPTVVKEGNQLSRDDSGDCGITQKGAAAPTAAKGPIASPLAKEVAASAAGGILLWTILQQEDPVSPSMP